MHSTLPLMPRPADTFFAFYAANLRGSLFSGFLTLGSFLVAVNTFIVVNMKKELYDSRGYRDRVAKMRALNERITFFGPLRRLSALLFWTIILAIGTSVSQLTVGIVFHHWLAAAFCIALAAATIAMLIAVLVVIKRNLRSWFDYMEDEAQKQLAAEAHASTKPASPPRE